MPGPAAPTTLAELEGPQAPSIVAGIGMAVWAGLELSGDRGAALTGASVLLDDEGAPDVGDRGERLGELSDDDPIYAAPEVRAGGAPSMQSDLYGLGVLLYRLATGQLPSFNPGRPGPPPAPSTLRPDLPVALDRAILLLLDADPERRTQALGDMHDVAGPLPDLRRLSAGSAPPATTVGVGEVKYTTTATRTPRPTKADAPLRTILAVPAGQVASLSPADRSAIAARTGAPLAAIDAVIASRRAMPVQVGLRGGQGGSTDLPVEAVTPVGLGTATAAIGLTGLGSAGVLVGLVLAIFFPLVGLGLAGVSLLPLLASLFLWVSWIRERGTYLQTGRTWRQLGAAAAQARAHALTGGAWTRMAAVRAALEASDLPEAALIDLRSGLAGVETELHRLGDRWSATNEALAAAGAPADPLEGRASTLADEAARLEQSLEELAVLLGRATHVDDVEEGASALETAMNRVLHAAELAADAVDPTEAERRRRAAAATREGG